MSKWYGSLNNRIAENRMYTDDIKVGTGVTEYSWSDREAYEVIEVLDQKHVRIRKLDHKPAGEPYSNEWDLSSNENNPTFYLTKRGKYWYFTTTLTAADIEGIEDDHDYLLRVALAGFDIEKIREKGKQTKYKRANVSFGVADYYYDYSF